jgi:hypothetical protein
VNGARGRPRVARLVPVACAAMLLGGALDARQDGAWRVEGALENDAFLPTSKPAEEALARGDRSLAQARKAAAAGNAAEAQRQEGLAFEAWHDALSASARGDAVWVEPEGSAERRLALGIETAVQHRLDSLAPDARRNWTERFGSLAERALAACGTDPGRLADAARLHPGTRAAARAWTMLGDLAFERGASEEARSAWRRATAATEWVGDEARGLSSRAEIVGPASDTRAPTEEALDAATALEATGAVDLPDPAVRLTPYRLPQASTGVRPGLAFLSDGRVAVQTASSVHLVRLDDAGRPRVELAFRPADLVPDAALDLDMRIGRRPPGWPLVPAARDGDLALVVGRGDDGTSNREGEPNGLFLVRPDDGSVSEGIGLRFPRLRWALVGNRRFAPGEEPRVLEGLEELAGLVFHPGPLLTDELLVVQARRGSGNLDAWILAFDRGSGSLRWSRLLASGAEVAPDPGRLLTTARFPTLAASPLAARDGLAFVSTHLGTVSSVDLAQGNLVWSLKTARRSAAETGWDGGPPRFPPRTDDDVVLVAPSDSRFLYALFPAPAVTGDGAASVLARPPLPIGNATSFEGGDGDALVLRRTSGVEEILSERRGERNADSVALAPSESFQGRAWVGRARVVASSSSRLFLLDRSRGLYVLDDEPLPTPDSPPQSSGGDVHVRGRRILVLSRDALFAFRCR